MQFWVYTGHGKNLYTHKNLKNQAASKKISSKQNYQQKIVIKKPGIEIDFCVLSA